MQIRVACAVLTAINLTCSALMDTPNKYEFQRYHFESIDGVDIHYEYFRKEKTNNKQIIFVHGFGASLQVWRELAAFLPQEYDLIGLDLKGFGFSSKTDDGDYSPVSQARILSTFTGRVSAGKELTIIGHSYGGGVSILAYLSFLEAGSESLLSSLVLIDPAVYSQDYPFMVEALRQPLTRILGNYFTTPEFRVRFTLERLFAKENFSKITEQHIARYAYFLKLDGGQRAIADVARQIDQVDAVELVRGLSSISVPTLLIWGARDPIFDVSQGRALANAVPNSMLRIIEQCGHAPHEEVPMKTAVLIGDFFEAESK